MRFLVSVVAVPKDITSSDSVANASRRSRVRDSDVTVRGLKRTAQPRRSTRTRRHSHASGQADIPLNDAGFSLVERRGRDLNPRRT